MSYFLHHLESVTSIYEKEKLLPVTLITSLLLEMEVGAFEPSNHREP